MFLGTDIGWVDVMEYHDADGSCAISMQELGNVYKTHYQACLSFLQNSHTTKGAPHTPQLSTRCPMAAAAPSVATIASLGQARRARVSHRSNAWIMRRPL